MPDIKKIQIGETLYDIKDEVARGALDAANLEISNLEDNKANKSEIVNFKNIYFSTIPPTSSEGENGDIWLVY